MGQQISTQDLGQSIKAINHGQNIMTNSDNDKEESVDDLVKKLAKKGKKVKLIDETGSVKELPVQENNDVVEEDPDLDRNSVEQVNDSIDEINEEVAPSSVKKKISKIKDEREEEEEQIEDLQPNPQIEPEEKEQPPPQKDLADDPDIQSAEKLLEQQAAQQQVIEQTNQALQEEAKKRADLEALLQ